jgi:hypothetical protein
LKWGKKGANLYLPENLSFVENPRKKVGGGRGGKSEKNSAVIKIVVKFYGVSFSSSSSSSSSVLGRHLLPRGTHMDVSHKDCPRGVISSRRITVLWTTSLVFFFVFFLFCALVAFCVLVPFVGWLRITLLHGGFGEFVARIGGF